MLEYAFSQPQDLPQWNHFLRVQLKSKEAGLNRLTALAEARTLEPPELTRAFHFVFYNTLARSTFTEHYDLGQVTGRHSGIATPTICVLRQGGYPALQRTRCRAT